MLSQRLLQETPEGIGRGERPRRGAHGEKTVGIHGLHGHGDLSGRGGEHSRKEESRRIVRHHATGASSKSLQESLPGSRFRFYVGIEAHLALGEGAKVFHHSLEKESVVSVACPGGIRLRSASSTRSGFPISLALSTAR